MPGSKAPCDFSRHDAAKRERSARDAQQAQAAAGRHGAERDHEAGEDLQGHVAAEHVAEQTEGERQGTHGSARRAYPVARRDGISGTVGYDDVFCWCFV